MNAWFNNFRKRYKITREQPQFWHFPKLGFGYIQIPKVATRSIRAGLMGAQGIQAGMNDFSHFENQFSAHMSHANIRKSAAGDVIFAFVRHPLARLYSAYSDKILNARAEGRRNIFACHGVDYSMDFAAFAETVCAIDDRHLDRHLRSQSWFLVDSQGLIPSFIGHLENFNEDWDRLRSQAPALGTVGHLNMAAGDADFFAQYSPQLRQRVEARFADDFINFGYSIGS